MRKLFRKINEMITKASSLPSPAPPAVTTDAPTPTHPLISPALLLALRQARGDAIIVNSTAPETLFPITIEINAAAALRERKERGQKTYLPGEMVEGEGIYLGRYTPVDRNRQFLRKKFNVFAAPEDLTVPHTGANSFSYYDARTLTSALENWHGFNGSDYTDDSELQEALKAGSYKGTWIIPPLEILAGRDKFGCPITSRPSLDQHIYSGAFKNSFPAHDPQHDPPLDYWSSTIESIKVGTQWTTRFGDHVTAGQDRSEKLRCRLVRLVELPST